MRRRQRFFTGRVTTPRTFSVNEVVTLLLSARPKEEAVRLFIESQGKAPFTVAEVSKALDGMPKSTIYSFIVPAVRSGKVKEMGKDELAKNKPMRYRLV